MLYTCACCGYKTLQQKPPESWEICPVCFWEQDNVQASDPHYHGGANGTSLCEAQHNFLALGACEDNCIDVVRPPSAEEQFDTTYTLHCEERTKHA